ncbi:hypothetical protein BDW22DRAFT_257054 [Trametopsis cervina]|nr:hypothetical protein BDW22DRAFT_257054 [Trametopsis cervina]
MGIQYNIVPDHCATAAVLVPPRSIPIMQAHVHTGDGCCLPAQPCVQAKGALTVQTTVPLVRSRSQCGLARASLQFSCSPGQSRQQTECLRCAFV